MMYTPSVSMTIEERRHIIALMREMGVRRFTVADMTVTFHESAPADEDQHEPPAAPAPMTRRVVSRLVPRVAIDPDNQ